jgi:hypothetical protein
MQVKAPGRLTGSGKGDSGLSDLSDAIAPGTVSVPKLR